jgi:small nuclear ribonucleoprotein (snRNP)-like protein
MVYGISQQMNVALIDVSGRIEKNIEKNAG